jgi:hypothetical protein
VFVAGVIVSSNSANDNNYNLTLCEVKWKPKSVVQYDSVMQWRRWSAVAIIKSSEVK